MISYLVIGLSRQAIVNYNISNLFYLVWFALSRTRLQVEDFHDSITGKYVMAAFNPFLKSKPLKELYHTGKRDICVSAAS
jgi:hypothetical protein